MKKLMAQPAGILVVLWGWAQFLNYFRYYFVRQFSFSFITCKTLEYLTNGLMVLALLYTLNYLYVHRILLKQQVTKSLLTIWIGWLMVLVFINLIQHNVMGHIVFEMQHTLFMLLTAYAILTTGSMIRSRWMWIGGVLFALLALGASYTTLKNQMALEAIGWMVGFVIPGHILMRRK